MGLTHTPPPPRKPPSSPSPPGPSTSLPQAMGELDRTPPPIRKPAPAASPSSSRPSNLFTSLCRSPLPAASPPSPQPSTSNGQGPPPPRQSSRKRGPHPKYTQFDLSGDVIPSSRSRRTRASDLLSLPYTPARHSSPPPPSNPAVAQPSAPAAPIHAVPALLSSSSPPHPVAAQPQPPVLDPLHPPPLDPDAEEGFWGGEPAPNHPTQPIQALVEEAEGGSQPAPQVQPAPAPLPSFQESSQTYIPTLKWPPRSVRADFTRTLADLWQQVADKLADAQGWLLISIFPRSILPARMGPERAGEGESKAKLIRDRLRRWRQGEHAALWREALQITSAKPRAKKKHAGAAKEKSQQELNVERATKLCQEGQYTKALQALVSLGIADHNQASLREMQSWRSSHNPNHRHFPLGFLPLTSS